MEDQDKEQQKLTANWINALAAGSITAGVFGPIIAYQFGVSQAPFDSTFVGGSALWFTVGVVLHIAAYLSLTGYGEP